jgi:hypothetical protein
MHKRNSLMKQVNPQKCRGEKMLESEELDIGKLCTKGKRIWGQSKREIVQSDKLDKVEAATFGADPVLAELVKQRDDIEKAIILHVDERLKEMRAEIPGEDPANMEAQ